MAASHHGTCCENETSIPSQNQVRRKLQQPPGPEWAGGVTPWRIEFVEVAEAVEVAGAAELVELVEMVEVAEVAGMV